METYGIKPGEQMRFDSFDFEGEYCIWEYVSDTVVRCIETNHREWQVGELRENVYYTGEPRFTVIHPKSQNFNDLYEKLSYEGY